MPKDVCGVVIAIACRSVLVQWAVAGAALRTGASASQSHGRQRGWSGSSELADRTGSTCTGARCHSAARVLFEHPRRMERARERSVLLSLSFFGLR